MSNFLRDQIVSVIDTVNDMTIATIRSDGFPQPQPSVMSTMA